MNNKKVALVATVIVAVVLVAAISTVVCFGFNNERTATFNQNYDGSSNIVVKANDGDEISSPYAARQGYMLVGWYLDKECKNVAEFPYKLTSNTTFYARWSDQAAAAVFNLDYLTDTESGKALYNKSQITTNSSMVKIDGKEFNSLIVSSGDSFLVLDLNTKDDKYSVVSLDDFSIMFTIPSKDLIQIKTVGLDKCNAEFIIVQYYSGYYLYDLSGKSVGPSASEPKIILADTILFNEKVYRFNSAGSIYAAFDASASTHIPNGGNGSTYYELVTMNVSVDSINDTYSYGVNILDSKFNVIKTIKFEDKAKLGNCVTLGNGGYLIQYGIEGTSGTDFNITKDGTSYIVKSVILDKDLNETNMKFNFLIEESYDRLNNPSINWDMYGHDTSSIMRILKNTTIVTPKITTDVDLDVKTTVQINELIKISSNGKHITVLDRLNEVEWTTTSPMSTSCHYLVTENQKTSIVDGSGKIAKISVSDIVNMNGVRYFITNTADDYNIYDVNGKIVGGYSGYTYKGSSHNNLFFVKDDNTYIFRNGTMSQLCTGTDVGIYDWGYSCGAAGVYTYYTESGNVITTSGSISASTYLSNTGDCFVNIKTVSGGYRLFKVTA